MKPSPDPPRPRQVPRPALAGAHERPAGWRRRRAPGVAAAVVAVVAVVWLALAGGAAGGEGVAGASRERPYENGLGMRFVPVPGTDVLMSVWETRVEDYAAFAAESPGVDERWKDVEYREHGQGDDHPVVNVSWEDAQAFCEWLTKRERAAGRIGEDQAYRLPTDHEWSVAVGIGGLEDAGATPAEKGRVVEGYPWGRSWPPLEGAGNYNGKEGASYWDKIEGYRDGHPFTSPVGSYRVNALGIYDLGGNVDEWCEDWYDEDEDSRVLRGGSWYVGGRVDLGSSYRNQGSPGIRNIDVGFRCVLG